MIITGFKQIVKNKIEQFEDEWGQFCEIDKKILHKSNRD